MSERDETARKLEDIIRLTYGGFGCSRLAGAILDAIDARIRGLTHGAPVQPEATAGAEVWSVFDTGPDWDESVYRSGAHCDMCDQTAVSFLCARHRGMLAVRGPAPVGAKAPEPDLDDVLIWPEPKAGKRMRCLEVALFDDMKMRADLYEKAVEALRALVWLVRTDIDDGFPVPRELTQAESFLRAHDAASTRKRRRTTMTTREALAYLRSLLPNDPQAIAAIGVLEMLADTADELAALHVEETAVAESK